MSQGIREEATPSIRILVDLQETSTPKRPAPTEETQRLRDCAKAGNTEMVRVWLEMKNNSHVAQEPHAQGRSALALAAAGGRADCVALLAPRATEDAIHDSIWMASQGGHAECVRLLAPAERHPSAAWSSLNAAAASGSAECLRLLLPAIWPDRVGASAAMALEHAASSGSVECLETLLPVARLEDDSPLGALQGALDDALRSAAQNGHINCARFLLSTASANPMTMDSQGRTALWLAASGGLTGHMGRKSHAGHVECARLLAPVSDTNAAPCGAPSETPLWVALTAANAFATAVECVEHLAPFSDVSTPRHVWAGEPYRLVSCVEIAESRAQNMPELAHIWTVLDALAAELPLADLRELMARSEPARLPRALAIVEAQ